jgi:hypothetical protein
LKKGLGDAAGEVLLYAACAILAGILVLACRGVDALLQTSPILGAAVIGLVAAGVVYGLVWTIRVRPGLYLESLRDDPERQARLGTPRRRVRLAGMAFLQLVIASLVGYGVTVAMWSRP